MNIKVDTAVVVFTESEDVYIQLTIELLSFHISFTDLMGVTQYTTVPLTVCVGPSVVLRYYSRGSYSLVGRKYFIHIRLGMHKGKEEGKEYPYT